MPHVLRDCEQDECLAENCPVSLLPCGCQGFMRDVRPQRERQAVPSGQRRRMLHRGSNIRRRRWGDGGGVKQAAAAGACMLPDGLYCVKSSRDC